MRGAEMHDEGVFEHEQQRKDERLERPALVPVARQCAQDRQADLLGEVLYEVTSITGQPGEPGAAVALREGVDTGQQIVRGLLVPLGRATDQGADLPRPVGRGRFVVTTMSG